MYSIPLRNTVIERDGFYISYNNYDRDIYDTDTTALVIGQMEYFYILKGNHIENYSKLFSLSKCLDYFKNHVEQIAKYSEKLKD